MMQTMRTTITIDDELMAQIDVLRKREGLTFKGAINHLLRAGLREHSQPVEPRPYKTRPRRLELRAGIDPTKLNQLVDELEAEAFLAKAGKSR